MKLNQIECGSCGVRLGFSTQADTTILCSQCIFLAIRFVVDYGLIENNPFATQLIDSYFESNKDEDGVLTLWKATGYLNRFAPIKVKKDLTGYVILP